MMVCSVQEDPPDGEIVGTDACRFEKHYVERLATALVLAREERRPIRHLLVQGHGPFFDGE